MSTQGDSIGTQLKHWRQRRRLSQLALALDAGISQRHLSVVGAPELSVARGIVEQMLHGHFPHPALAVDRHWTLLSANAAVTRL